MLSDARCTCSDDRKSFLNPCLPSTLTFVETVIAAVTAMHEQAGAPLRCWHYGGDEAKNIHLGPGFQDVAEPEPVDFKGTRPLAGKEDLPCTIRTIVLDLELQGSRCYVTYAVARRALAWQHTALASGDIWPALLR